MTKITKVVCTFIATEFDADLNVVSEKPVAIGRNEVEAILFHPFDAPLRGLVNELNARLEDAQEAATPPRAPSGGEARLPGGEPAVQRQAADDQEPGCPECGASGDGEEGGEPADQDGGGPHQTAHQEGDEQSVEPQGGDPVPEPQQGRQDEVRIDELRAYDLDRAAHLVEQSTIDAGKPLTIDTIRHLLWDECIYGDGLCLLAYTGERLAGVFVGLHRMLELIPHYEVWSLYVLPQYRGAGVATALIERMAEWTTEDIPVLITTTGVARPFYKSLGFEEECRINASSVSKIKEALGRI